MSRNSRFFRCIGVVLRDRSWVAGCTRADLCGDGILLESCKAVENVSVCSGNVRKHSSGRVISPKRRAYLTTQIRPKRQTCISAAIGILEKVKTAEKNFRSLRTCSDSNSLPFGVPPYSNSSIYLFMVSIRYNTCVIILA